MESYLVAGAADISNDWLSGKKSIGVTAGASAPEVLVQDVINKLKAAGGKTEVEYDGIEENITFSIPKELRRMDMKSPT